MKITDNVPPAYAKQGISQGQSGEKASESRVTAAKRGDKVSLSAKARELQSAQQTVRQMPDIDMEKVARTKAQLDNGTYVVDAQKAAAGMLSESLLKQNE